MKSLYNKSGILPALFMNSRVDCGIAWSEHRKVERVKREDVIPVEAPQLTVDPAGQGSDQTVTTAFTLKPIDPQTIQVGDTVRLVGVIPRYEWAGVNAGENYKVVQIDEGNDGMKARIYAPGGKVWIYNEDLMLVESA